MDPVSLLNDYAGAVVAAVAALTALIAMFIARSETQKQKVLRADAIRHANDGRILAWGNNCVDVLNKAAMFARTRQHQKSDESFLQQRVNIMLAVSSLIERGRLLFPAMKGSLRPPVLDALQYAYYELEALTRTDGPTAQNSAEYLDHCRRLLMSELQNRLHGDQVSPSDQGRKPQPKHDSDAVARAAVLKDMLRARRPSLDLEEREVPLQ